MPIWCGGVASTKSVAILFAEQFFMPHCGAMLGEIGCNRTPHGLEAPLMGILRGRTLIASHNQEGSSIFTSNFTAKRPKPVVIIPAYNEECSIGLVVGAIPRDLVEEIIVVDNGSSDATAHVAETNGARVVSESRRGYGSACMAGISQLPEGTEVVIFMDGDYSDYPDEIQKLVDAQSQFRADLVVGSRALGRREPGSLTVQQRFGNWLSTWLIKRLYGHSYTDLGPFRLIRTEALERLKMQDHSFGWTVEMQVKALQQGLKVIEVPVNYRKRIGKSKVSGTLLGSVKAGLKILWVIGRLAFHNPVDREH
jgi:glycosyltransferase involved in cell wall biosynthesis